MKPPFIIYTPAQAYTQSSMGSATQDEQVIVTRETTGGKTLSFKQVTGNYILTKQRAT